eukprot:332396-Prymnesium_polylepis.1
MRTDHAPRVANLFGLCGVPTDVDAFVYWITEALESIPQARAPPQHSAGGAVAVRTAPPQPRRATEVGGGTTQTPTWRPRSGSSSSDPLCGPRSASPPRKSCTHPLCGPARQSPSSSRGGNAARGGAAAIPPTAITRRRHLASTCPLWTRARNAPSSTADPPAPPPPLRLPSHRLTTRSRPARCPARPSTRRATSSRRRRPRCSMHSRRWLTRRFHAARRRFHATRRCFHATRPRFHAARRRFHATRRRTTRLTASVPAPAPSPPFAAQVTAWYYGPPGSFGRNASARRAGGCTPVDAARNDQVGGGVPGDGPSAGSNWGYQVPCGSLLAARSPALEGAG